MAHELKVKCGCFMYSYIDLIVIEEKTDLPNQINNNKSFTTKLFSNSYTMNDT